RDYKVTGVQTCALPISVVAVVATLGVAGANLPPARVEQHRAVLDALVEPPAHGALRLARDGRDHLDDDPAALWRDPVSSLLCPRSEERRVGKEVRCERW